MPQASHAPRGSGTPFPTSRCLGRSRQSGGIQHQQDSELGNLLQGWGGKGQPQFPPPHIWLFQAARTNHPRSTELRPPKQPQRLPQLAFPITLPGPARLLRLQSWVRTELSGGTRLPPLPSQQKAQSFQHAVGWGIKAALHLAQPRTRESLGILQGCGTEELQAAGGKLRPSHGSSISSPARTLSRLLPSASSCHPVQTATRLLRRAARGGVGLHFACSEQQ